MFIQSLASELGEYFADQYFNQTLPYFTNLSNTMKAYQIVIVIGAVFLGILVACFAYVYQKKVVGKLPRMLISAGAVSEETAVPLSALPRKINRLTKCSLASTSGGLRKIVRCSGQHDLTYEEMSQKGKNRIKPEKIDPETASFYVPEERKEEVLRRFDESGNTWKNVLLVALGCLVLFLVICRFLPEILSVVDVIAGFLPG